MDNMEYVSVSIVDNYLSMNDWRVKENANRIFGYGGLKAYIAESVIARYMLKKYGEKAEKAHRTGDIHIHDLSHATLYCCGYNIDKVLYEGINGISGVPESKPPKHFSSAVSQILNFVMCIQQEQAGAVGLNCLDTYLAPFVHYDKLSYRQVKQVIQELIWNLNYPMRPGLETPFTNVTFDAHVREDLKDQHVVIGGEVKDKTYGEFEEEMLMIDKAIMEVMYYGDAKNRVFTFPIVTVNITDKLDWDSDFGYWLKKITSKYGIPYFQNMISTDLRPDDVQAFCCRLRSDIRKLKKSLRYGGIFGKPGATGSIGVVTINLPRIGYLARTESEFFDLLDERLEIARHVLNTRRAFVEEMMKKGLYPFLKRFLGTTAWHFNTVSIVGAHECLLNMGYQFGILDGVGISFIKEVLSYIRKRINEFEEEDEVSWNFEQAPAESASGRLKKLDVEKFGTEMPAIKETGKDVSYTNSIHIPAWIKLSIHDTLRFYEQFEDYFDGGRVVHIYMIERVPEDLVDDLVMKICKKTKITYFDFTITFSVCQEHGAFEGEHYHCPVCGKECEVWSRVVGYYKPVQNWNEWKRREFELRKKYKRADIEILA